MSNILFEYVVDAPVDKVYDAITQESGIKGWWTADVHLAQKEGSEARFGFGDHGEMRFEVSKLVPNKQVVWETVQAMPDWDGTQVSFDLSPDDNGTRIHFAHRNFATEDGSFAFVTYNWAYFLFSLRSYLEKGEGTPTPA